MQRLSPQDAGFFIRNFTDVSKQQASQTQLMPDSAEPRTITTYAVPVQYTRMRNKCLAFHTDGVASWVTAIYTKIISKTFTPKHHSIHLRSLFRSILSYALKSVSTAS